MLIDVSRCFIVRVSITIIISVLLLGSSLLHGGKVGHGIQEFGISSWPNDEEEGMRWVIGYWVTRRHLVTPNGTEGVLIPQPA